MVELYGGDPIGSAALTEQGTYAVPSSAGQVLGASVREGVAAMPFFRSMRAAGAFTAETGVAGADEFGRPIQVEPEPPMDTEAVNAEFAIPGVLKFDKPTPRSVAQDLYEHKREQILRQDIIDRREGGILTGGAARFVAEMAGGVPDPFGLAIGFIPVVGQARQAALIARAAGATERAVERFAIGGAQGALGMAALQPLEFALSRREQEDYTMADALRSIALGTVLGGGLHAGIGALGDRAAARLNPLSRMLEEAGPEVRQGLLRNALSQMVDGRPVNLEPILDIADALRSREIARMTVRQGGREIDQALPGAFEDPLVLARRGELTAERAAQIRDDLKTLTPAEVARAKAQIGEHVDPQMWTVIADNVAKAEGSRQGAIDVVADQLRYLPASGAIRSASEREAAAVIGRAMQTEAARGGDVGGLIDEAMRISGTRAADGGGSGSANIAREQALDLGDQPSPRRAAAISEGERPISDMNASEADTAIINSSAEAPPGVQPLARDQVSTRARPSADQISRESPPSIFANRTLVPLFSDFPLGSIEETSSRKILQGSADAKALLGAAREHVAPLRARLAELTQDIPGAEVIGVRSKDEAGLADKIDAKGRSPATISDYLGGRISADTPDAFNRVIDALERTGAVIDRADEFIEGGKGGYRASHLQVSLGDGMSAEIQIVPSPIARVLEEAHALRENYKRVIDRGGVPDGQTIDRVQQIFDDAWAAADPEWHDFSPAGAGAAQRQQLLDMYARGLEDAAARARSGPLKTPVPDNQPFERAPAAGETGGPRASDTVAEINAQADELERLQRSMLGEKPLSAESVAEAEAAAEGAAEAEARASALDQAAVCIMRG